jgi:hypothetical protein
MKNAFFKNFVLIAIMFFAMNVRGETIIGVSEPFQFGGSQPADVPVSPLALVFGALLIVLFTFWRFYLSRKKGIA